MMHPSKYIKKNIIFIRVILFLDPYVSKSKIGLFGLCF